jgi:hypothetical protein
MSPARALRLSRPRGVSGSGCVGCSAGLAAAGAPRGADFLRETAGLAAGALRDLGGVFDKCL